MSNSGLVYKEPIQMSPCRQACPAGIDIPRYLRYISQGKFGEALAVIRESIPFPSVCGHICTRPCETRCTLGRVSPWDGPVNINALKRFVSEREAGKGINKVTPGPTGKRVAIIGAGPAGLTAAYYLRLQGHNVTILESQSKPGGMLRWGIPRYHLPEDVLEREISDILGLGIELKLSSPVDRIKDLLNDYHAVFIAIGAQEGRKLDIPGANFAGVLVGSAFLHDVSLGKKVELGQKVLVLGGGGVACDVARTARRLGVPQVQIACLESRENMPALPWEIEEVEREGIIIHPLHSFIRIVGDDGRASGVECLKLKWMKFDDGGGLHMEPIKGSEHVIEADTVIFTVGEAVNPSLVSDILQIKISRRRTIVADAGTLQTGCPQVFAGGDAVTGPASAIEAITAGRKAAISIDRYLGGKGVIEEIQAPEREVRPVAAHLPGERLVVPTLALEQRLTGFTEVEQTLSEQDAIKAAERCLGCDLTVVADASKCVGCETCQLRCSYKFEKTFNPAKAAIRIERVSGDSEYAISFSDKCDNCGLCTRYCLYGALSQAKKPVPEANT